MEGRLVYVDHVGSWLGHQRSCNPLGELLLGVHQLAFSIYLRAIDNLWLPVGGSVFYVDLPYQPSGELWQLQLLLPEGCPLFEGHMALQ